jgi:GntR family transcriptional regulator, transcriptional repressor for pyruvate dehydrogenase complex
LRAEQTFQRALTEFRFEYVIETWLLLLLSMPIKVIEPRRLYLEIAAQIRSLIENGEFPLTSRLPAERELAKEFGVSRPSVREALIALEVEGYVDVRPGSGVFVTRPKNPAPDYSRSEGPLEIIRARKVIEGEIAAEAAAHIRQKDVAVLGRSLLELERAAVAPDPSSCISADRSFHLYIAKKTRNNILLRIVTDLFDQRSSLLGEQFGAHFDNPKTWTAVIAEHRKIIRALAGRDSEQARKAMHSHLSRAHDRWARELENGKKSKVNSRARRIRFQKSHLRSR